VYYPVDYLMLQVINKQNTVYYTIGRYNPLVLYTIVLSLGQFFFSGVIVDGKEIYAR
jgi:hypothetical protein